MRQWFPLVFLLLAAGCAGAPVRQEAIVPAPGETVVELKAESYSFTPSTLTVPAGKPLILRIRNEATVIPHSFVLENGSGTVLVRQPLIKGSETLIRIAPLAAGSYPFYCAESLLGSTHRGKGMEGKLEAKGN